MFEMKGLELSNSSDVEQSLFDSSTHASFASLLVDNKNYGPARVGFSIKNLDANVFVEINDKVSQTQNMSDMARQQALLALLPLLPKLVATGALIELTDLNVVIPEGVVQGAFKLQLPNDLNSSNPFQLVQKLTGEGSLHIPVPAFTALYTQSVVNKLTSAHVLVNQEQVIQQQVVANQVVVAAPGATTTAQAPEVPVTPTPASPVNQAPIPAISSAEIAQQAAVQAQQKIDQLIKVGALVKEGNDYVVKISINGGQLVVNGHPFDSAMLQF
jgi:uncharacterized protein YdgA (DUF945 family)